MNTDTTISANGLSVGYKSGRKKTVIHSGLNFSLEQGKLTSLLGANGSGKSTLIKTLCGFIPPLEGEILFGGKKLSAYPPAVLSRHIGAVLTDRNIDGGLTAYELASLGRYPYTGFFGKLGREDDRIVRESLERVRMTEKADIPVALLSDGERQKIMIAKTLTQECDVIVLDEPSAFLDVKSRIEITNLLRDIAVNNGKTVVMSTHDLELALQLSDKLWILSCAFGLEEGYTEDLILAGGLGHIFGEGDIAFDRDTGSFRHDRTPGRRVSVTGKGERFYWVKNALCRNGYACVADEEAGSFATVCLESPAGPVVSFDGRKEPFASIEQLIVLLKKEEKRRIKPVSPLFDTINENDQ